MSDQLQPCPVCGATVYTKEGDTYRWLVVCCSGQCGAMWEVSSHAPDIAWDTACFEVKDAIANKGDRR